MIRGEKMNKIAIIIPYFGSLPNYYDVWKKSVIKNETIDFYLVTDIKNIKNEKKESLNIKVKIDEKCGCFFKYFYLIFQTGRICLS